MCGRYYVDENAENELQRLIGSGWGQLIQVPVYGEIRPSEKAVVLIGSRHKSMEPNIHKVISGEPQKLEREMPVLRQMELQRMCLELW